MENVDTVQKNVEALIGYFNLDPNRVLDIILDSFSNNLWNREPYIFLLREYKGEYVAQVLGFKFQCAFEKLQAALKLATPRTQENIEALEAKIPKTLCVLTAILISKKIVAIECIWSHLSDFKEAKDDVDEIEVLLKKQIKLAQYQYKSLFESVMNKEAYETMLKAKLLDQEEIRTLREEMHYNFRLWLLESFVKINQWD